MVAITTLWLLSGDSKALSHYPGDRERSQENQTQVSEKDCSPPPRPSPRREILLGLCQPHNRSGDWALLQIGKTRLREVEELGGDHTAGKSMLIPGQGWGGRSSGEAVWGPSGAALV